MSGSFQHHQPSHLQRVTLSWNNIHTPGAYVAMDGQTLYRVPENSFAAGQLANLTMIGAGCITDGIEVSKISDDPNITISKARQLCADSDIHPDF